jgi:GTPase SAR1 family protein
MFGLLSSFVDALLAEQDPPYRILLLGLDGAGKTTLLHALRDEFSTRSRTSCAQEPPTVRDAFSAPDCENKQRPDSKSSEPYTPTIGLDCYSTSVSVLGSSETWIFWDLGGDASVRSLWNKYLLQADAVVWVIDGSDTARQAESIAALDETWQRLSTFTSSVPAEAALATRDDQPCTSLFRRPLLVAINRLDQAEVPTRTAGWPDAFLSLSNRIAGYGNAGPFAFQHIDAFTGYGIQGVIRWLAANRPARSRRKAAAQ